MGLDGPLRESVTLAISKSSISSTNRSKKTVRWRSESFRVAFHMASICSFADAIVRATSAVFGIESDCGRIDRPRDPLQNLKTAARFVIAHQVRGDLHQPGGDAGAPAKPVARLIGPNETVLRQIFRRFPIPERGSIKRNTRGRYNSTSASKWSIPSAIATAPDERALSIRRFRPIRWSRGLQRSPPLGFRPFDSNGMTISSSNRR